ncbi:DarT1-associated NADAR antitoxin family protein [Psychrobacter sp. I-STPA10]|uniref:DarT1-associated NADAR antitoxin family protein n=1 Tax=Psychrobacter sp. I-STPA10 TaxID=2585769 RepID=UPI001E5509A2|nr:hypothetical protein [Psychrobacter sp. I-STPA10]
MATRPVFIANPTQSKQNHSLKNLVDIQNVDFKWFAGFALLQKQKCIESLHNALKAKNANIHNVLEISSKSKDKLGVALSAFNLMMSSPQHTNKSNQADKYFSVECAFQSSKIFQTAEPASLPVQYLDLLDKTSKEAKTDPRLKNSGAIIGFNFKGQHWDNQPLTAFYDWLYITALTAHPEYHQPLLSYDAFTDIEFNPKKSINCQAHAVALFCALLRRGLLDKVMQSQSQFLRIYDDTIELTS